MSLVKGVDRRIICAYKSDMTTGKRGRPKLRKALQKGAHINIRLTDEQKDELTAAARHAGLGVSPWMLALALKEARKPEGG